MQFLVRTFTLFLCISSLSHALGQTQGPQVSSGKVDRYTNFASQFVPARNVDVWLPEHYAPEKKYAVVYMHDGQMLFDAAQTWNKQEWNIDSTVGSLIQRQEIQDCIVVGIWNIPERRKREYFPQDAMQFIDPLLMDSVRSVEWQNDMGQANAYLSFIVRELKPFIDNNYATYTDRKHTIIAGSSMGGLISLYAICNYPAIFGGAICMSTHWPGSLKVINDEIPEGLIKYFKKHLPNPKYHKIYFDYGTETLDKAYGPFQKEMNEVMRKKGYKKTSFLIKVFNGDDHSEHAWARRFHLPLTFMLGVK